MFTDIQPFFMNKSSPLVSFQSSVTVVFDSCCQCSRSFYGRATFHRSFPPTIPAIVTASPVLTCHLFLRRSLNFSEPLFLHLGKDEDNNSPEYHKDQITPTHTSVHCGSYRKPQTHECNCCVSCWRGFKFSTFYPV